MKGKVLVAGVGNIFFGDDAFGVEVARRLAATVLPENVTVKDFGIRSYDLAYALMEEWDLVVLVDAVSRGGEPGTVYTIEPDFAESGEGSANVDAHTMHPAAVFSLVRALGGTLGRTIVVGCEPSKIDEDAFGSGALSAPVAAAVADALDVIHELASTSQKSAVIQ